MQNEDLPTSIDPATSPLPVISYAPPNLRSPWSRADWLTIAIAGGSAALYAIACIPSYGRSFWPPVDHLCDAIPWLWILAIPLLTRHVPGGRFSRLVLLGYAVLTGTIDAWTFPYVQMNPHAPFDTSLWFANLIPTNLIHVGLTVAIALLSRLGWKAGRELLPPNPSRKLQLFRSRSALPIAIVLIALTAPFVYRRIALAADSRAGARMADRDWANQSAEIISRPDGDYRESNDLRLGYFVDHESGLPLKQSWMDRWEPGYNAEIRRWVALQGVPSWSFKSRVVSDADLIRILKSTGLQEVKSYPHVLSANLVLFRGAGVTSWGAQVGNSRDLSVLALHQPMVPLGTMGDENDPVFVGQLDKYPGDYFIRCGHSVAVGVAEGWVIQYAEDLHPTPSR